MVKGRKRTTTARKKAGSACSQKHPLPNDSENLQRPSMADRSSSEMASQRDTRIEDYFPALESTAASHEWSGIGERPPSEPEGDVPCPNAAALPAGPGLDATQPPSPSSGEQAPAAGATSESAGATGDLKVAEEDGPRVPPKSPRQTVMREAPKVAKKKGVVQCHSLTEYFPIRRSGRKTRSALAKERQKNVEDAILNGDEDGFKVTEFDNKGRGVTTIRPLRSGDFVLEYAGELIDHQEARLREQLYAADKSVGCYMYYFSCRNKQYCVDATKESGRLGRLVNHSKRGNLKTQTCIIKGVPHLVLVAQRDIQPGEELLYDYGDRSKTSLQFHPWLAL